VKNNSSKTPTHQYLLLAMSIVGLCVVPMIFVRSQFAGSDQQGTEAIEKIQPSYKPWFKSLIVLPSKEIENLMFSTQAALGAGVVGFVIGHYHGRSMAQERRKPPSP
jgi:cobalt/nickel transport protein